MRRLKHEDGRATDDVVLRDADRKLDEVERAAAIAERRLQVVEARANVYSRRRA